MSSADCLVVGHRGFKSKFTENTLHGFQKCFDTGATIFETDVWTTKDEVLVISHDVNTKRVFCDENGNETDYNILETNFEQLKPLRTIGSGEPLLTFQDVLRWFCQVVKETANPNHKIMLDLKNANPPKLVRLLFEDMLAVHADLEWWFPRIQIGVWNLRFVKFLNQDDYFQRLFRGTNAYLGYTCFHIYHISLSWQSSLTFLAYNEYLDTLGKDRIKFKIAGVSLIYVSTWSREFLEDFMPAVKKQNLNLYTWTVNRVSQLRYFCAIGKVWKLKEYGVITDYPDQIVDALAGERWKNAEKQLLMESWPSGEQQNVVIPRSFMLFAWIAKIMTYFFHPAQLSVNQLFESPVLPHEKLYVRPKLGNRIFAFLQAWGVF
ncbi:PLC-like phosphodiesterase [Metschnikowia bicuspidata var. bicuspidata NRRL YB-4993]|uniref:PLC-like phosphodiesterase n=1 Tax=Metschnikowia bicuspidata var. bicuspidata NRRL YB-4993 TaxID=869754 RepID=A0A1A0HJ77_9ASCO|nr:PLC-like phosphodiesterase [Metschnikowia bicuspidata var. bicuspidata NRRL YB-4993]OBA24209.1 PLC-like phosphodiesterase [Metschnikowia bicuspidata var. bicuspidata NRRL YB-4993]